MQKFQFLMTFCHIIFPKILKILRWNYIFNGLLPLINWGTFIVDHPDLEVNHTFAKMVHVILANGLKYDISQNDKNKIHELFNCKKCIPTTHGMKKPDEAYLQNVDLFSNLLTVRFRESFDY